jgi:hypothetical protein
MKSIAERIAEELNVKAGQVAAAIALLDGGSTVPFVARYRKEATGALDDTQLRTLEARLAYLRELDDRRRTILESIREQGKLDDALEAQINEAETKALRLNRNGLLTAAQLTPVAMSHHRPDYKCHAFVIKLKGDAIRRRHFYAVALGAALFLTASAASVQAEDRDCTVDLKSLCAGVAPGEGHVQACIQSHISELSVGCSSGLSKAAWIATECHADIQHFCPAPK